MTDPDNRPQAEAPSLFSPTKRQAGLPSDAGDSLRMLSGLDSTFGAARVAAPRARRWLFGLVGLLLAGAAFGIWQSIRPLPAEPSAPGVASKVAPLNVVTPPLAAVTQQVASSAATGVARIETTALPLPAASAAVAAVEAASAVQPQHAVAPREASARKSPAGQAAAPATPTRVALADPSRPTAVVKAKPAARANRGPDSDVELLEAMVAHLQGQDPVAPPVAPAADTRPQTIARLVEDCKQLAPEQLRQCRKQICEGYWGRAQACPIELDPLRQGVAAKAR